MRRTLYEREAEPLARRLDALRRVDDAAHAALRAVLPELVERGADERALTALVDLLCQTCTEEPAGTLALIGRLEGWVPEPVSVDVLRRWAVDGLQRYRNLPARRRRHFESADPMAFADREAASAAEHWLAHRARLQHYLAGFGFAGFRIELHPTQTGPDAPARVCIGDDLLLAPQRWAGSPAQGPARDRLYRAAAAHAAAHLRHSPRQRPGGNRHPGHLAVAGLIEDARVECLMVRQYPGLHALWNEFHLATHALAGFDFAGLTARLARALHDPAHADDNVWVATGRQLFANAALDLNDMAAFDTIGRQLAARMEKMRLPFGATSDRFMPSYRDDNSLLWNLNAVLPEDVHDTQVREHFELHKAVREPERPLRSVEVDLRQRRHYPEWDCKLETLRENWATVIEAAPLRARPHAAATPASRAARHPLHFGGLARIPDRALRLKRLHDGDELDLGAAIDSVVQRAGGVTPDPRIFMRHGRRRRSTAIVLLMDLSESTGRFVPGSFTSVLEVEKRAATLVAESLDASRDRIAVHGFSSNGRQEVNYVRIKEFDDPFGAEQRARLKKQENRLSTRMGAALRHASEALAGETAERKLILLLTDGEPSDVDVFEDDYLVEDARHAVTAAASRGVHSFCLTLDRHADRYVRRIFGARNYLIADKAHAFAGSTEQALARLIAQ